MEQVTYALVPVKGLLEKNVDETDVPEETASSKELEELNLVEDEVRQVEKKFKEFETDVVRLRTILTNSFDSVSRRPSVEPVLNNLKSLQAIETNLLHTVWKEIGEAAAESREEAMRREKGDADKNEEELQEPELTKGSKKPKKVNKQDRAKTLYMKIAKLSHPDRTGDQSKTKYFYQATVMYRKGDVKGLKAILDFLQGKGVTAKIKALRLKKAQIKEQELILKEEAKALMTGNYREVFELQKQGRLKEAENLCKEVYKVLIDRTEEKIASLREKLRRHRQSAKGASSGEI